MAIPLSNPDDLYRLMIAPAPWLSISYSLSDNYEINNTITSIDMTGFPQTAKSIGYTDPGSGFQGTFNGNGKTVTIGNVDPTNYYGFFSFTTNTISNLTVIYANDGISINDAGGVGAACGGLISDTSSNVTNCHVVFGNNVTLGQPTSGFCAPFIGDIGGSVINNCTLIAGNNLTVRGQNFSGGFIARMNGGTISNCTITIGNNLTITGFDIGGISGDGSIINNTSLSIGDNCYLNGSSGIGSGNYVGGIIGDTEFEGCVFNNIKAKYGINTQLVGDYVGGIVGEVTLGTDTMDNCIVLFKNNTQLLGSENGGGILSNGGVTSNVFGLFNDYSITGSSESGPIYAASTPVPPASVLTNTCGNPLTGSAVTNMSTTSLDAIIAYVQAIPYLADLIPYIQATYPCYTKPSAPILPPPCPCTAYLCNSNPQNTNYDESEDKSRKTDQSVRSNIDIKLNEMQAGTRVCGMPIFKSYDEMMMWKNGACKYRR